MNSWEQLKEAVETLANGGLVAFPTETVYGLGADASNPDAMERLYKVKNRPVTHPSIVHIGSADQIEDWCLEVPPAVEILAGLFWPGPLTMVLKRAPGVIDAVTGGQNTVALRVPSHPLAQSLLQAFGRGIAAPSANRFGNLSPTSAEDVKAEFGNEIMVLDGGSCPVGIESTIIDLSSGIPRILRPGMILEASITVALSGVGLRWQTADVNLPPRTPGSLPSHYAPAKPLKLISSLELENELAHIIPGGQKVAVMSFKKLSDNILHQVMSTSPAVYAFGLYRSLRRLDKSDADVIVVECPPLELEWEPILDRLKRAAGPRDIEVKDGT